MKVYYLTDKKERQKALAAGGYYTQDYIPCLLDSAGISGEALAPEDTDRVQPGDAVFAPEGAPLPPCRKITYPAAAEKTEGVKAEFELSGTKVYLAVPLRGEPVKKAADSLSFGFDLPGQLWFAGDGWPREPENFFVGRIPDASPLGKNNIAREPYNTALIRLVAGTLLEWGFAAAAPLPPQNGSLPDFGFMVSGDDDCCSRDINLEAAEVMNRLGLPYHINAMAAQGTAFCIDKADFEECARLGTETALHLDLSAVPADPRGETVRQKKLFEKTFGADPVTNCNHCLIQIHDCEEALLGFEDAGVIADNSKNGETNPEDINAFDMTGYGFGFMHPRYTVTKEGRVIGCMEIPQNYYEPRIGGKYGTDTGKLKNYFETGKKYMAVCQFFIHPHYLCSNNEHSAWSVKALEYALEYFKGKNVWITTTNRLALWWKQRGESVIKREGNVIVADAKAPLVLLLPPGAKAEENGSSLPAGKTDAGLPYIAIEKPGLHRIALKEA